MATNFDFLFSFSRKIDLSSPILMNSEAQIQNREVLSSFLQKAKSKIKIIFSKSDFNFHVNFCDLGWGAKVTKS